MAAILTITGYSVNDTIVIFDRVRENSRLLRREPLEKVVNLSVNQTLGRTIITAGTTFLSVLALYLFGGEVLDGFAFAMLVGIISGTYSTVFIAAAIAIILSGRKAPAGRAAVPVEEAVAERPAQGRPQRARLLTRALRGIAARGGAARRRAGTDRVPAGVEFRAPDSGPGVLRMERRAVRPAL